MTEVQMGYVIVVTNPRISHVGAVHGVFATKGDAEAARDNMGFPQPEDALIRPLYIESVTR